MKYHCDVCNKDYSSNNSLWLHNKRYHSNPDNTNKSIKKTTVCSYCNKTYTTPGNLKRHLETCKQKPTPEKKPLADFDREYILDMMKKLLSRDSENLPLNLSQENNPTIIPQNNFNSQNPVTTQSHNTTNTNTTQSHNNQSLNNVIGSNNNIQIITLGNENLSEVLSLNEKVNILKQKMDSLEACIKYVHFNNKYPQFHNIALTEQGDGFVYDENEKDFIEAPKEEMLIDLIENRMNDIYDFSKDAKGSIPAKTLSMIENLAAKFNNPNFESNKKQAVEGIVMEGTRTLVTNKKFRLRLRDNN